MIQALPKSDDFIARAGDAFLRGDATDALRNYERATELDPESADAQAGQALALLWLGKPTEAHRAALKAVAIFPTHLVALNVLARASYENKNLRRARQYCACVLDIDSTDAEALALDAEIARTLSPHGSFDAYVSLGFNCEAGLQFKRFGYEQSSFFRYTVAHFPEMFRLIESDFAGVFLRENLQPLVHDLITDHATGLCFHSELSFQTDPVSGRKTFNSDALFDRVYRQEFEKVQYLAEKWRRLAASEARVLYFLKYEGANARMQAAALRDLILTRYERHDFAILVLQTEDALEEDWKLDRVFNRYLPRFAPLDNVHDADRGGWDRCFEEFPLRKR